MACGAAPLLSASTWLSQPVSPCTRFSRHASSKNMPPHGCPAAAPAAASAAASAASAGGSSAAAGFCSRSLRPGAASGGLGGGAASLCAAAGGSAFWQHPMVRRAAGGSTSAASCSRASTVGCEATSGSDAAGSPGEATKAAGAEGAGGVTGLVGAASAGAAGAGLVRAGLGAAAGLAAAAGLGTSAAGLGFAGGAAAVGGAAKPPASTTAGVDWNSSVKSRRASPPVSRPGSPPDSVGAGTGGAALQELGSLCSAVSGRCASSVEGSLSLLSSRPLSNHPSVHARGAGAGGGMAAASKPCARLLGGRPLLGLSGGRLGTSTSTLTGATTGAVRARLHVPRSSA